MWVMCNKVCTTLPSMHYNILCGISCLMPLATSKYVPVTLHTVIEGPLKAQGLLLERKTLL